MHLAGQHTRLVRADIEDCHYRLIALPHCYFCSMCFLCRNSCRVSCRAGGFGFAVFAAALTGFFGDLGCAATALATACPAPGRGATAVLVAGVAVLIAGVAVLIAAVAGAGGAGA